MHSYDLLVYADVAWAIAWIVVSIWFLFPFANGDVYRDALQHGLSHHIIIASIRFFGHFLLASRDRSRSFARKLIRAAMLSFALGTAADLFHLVTTVVYVSRASLLHWGACVAIHAFALAISATGTAIFVGWMLLWADKKRSRSEK